MKSPLILLLLLSFIPALPAQEERNETPADRLEKRMHLADELESQGDDDGALKILGELSEADPENAALLERIVVLLIRNERLKEAVPRLRKLLEIKTGTGTEAEYAALARMMIEVNEHETAVDFLKDTSKRFPESADFPFLLTFPLARLERWEEAITQFEKTIALTREDRSVVLDEIFYFRYAAAHERSGNFAEAEKHFRKTLELLDKNDSDDEDNEFTATVLNYLAYMWVERGENLEEAGKMAQEAAELSPESGAIADTVGWYHFQTGNYPRALVELKKAERLLEEPDAVIFDHLGQTLSKLNEKKFAAGYFLEALKLDPKNEALKTRLAEVED